MEATEEVVEDIMDEEVIDIAEEFMEVYEPASEEENGINPIVLIGGGFLAGLIAKELVVDRGIIPAYRWIKGKTTDFKIRRLEAKNKRLTEKKSETVIDAEYQVVQENLSESK